MISLGFGHVLPILRVELEGNLMNFGLEDGFFVVGFIAAWIVSASTRIFGTAAIADIFEMDGGVGGVDYGGGWLVLDGCVHLVGEGQSFVAVRL